jgi:dehydratase
MTNPLRIPAAACVLGLAAALAAISPANAAALADPVPVVWDCQARPPIGDPQQVVLDAAITGTAPASVAPGSDFDVTLEPQPTTVPATANGFPVNFLKDLQLRTPVPAGTTLRGVTLSGGSNLGTGIPTVAEANGIVTLTVPGPLLGGTDIQEPAIHLALTATAAAGAAITTSLAGSSYTDPGLSYTANVQTVFGAFDVPATCFATPNVVLTTTTVTAP